VVEAMFRFLEAPYRRSVREHLIQDALDKVQYKHHCIGEFAHPSSV
jgi:hypothetical protein